MNYDWIPSLSSKVAPKTINRSQEGNFGERGQEEPSRRFLASWFPMGGHID